MNSNRRDINSELYETQYILNAPNFLSNNNNPFLVSPFTPTTNIVKKSQLSSIIIVIAAIEAELSTLFDFNTMTLRITNITNSAGGNSVTISTTNLNLDGTTINIDAQDTTITGNVYFSNNTYFSSINASTITAKNISFSTLTGSTINAQTINASNITFSTLTGSTISALAINASTINASNITFSTLTGSTISALTLNASTINASNITFSSLTMIPGTTSSLIPAVTTFNSSILINLNGVYWHIPIHPV
jgi:hypothetical protein